MFRFFLFSVIFVGWSALFSATSLAQGSTTPIGGAEGTWCASVSGGPVCGFGSPNAVCGFSMERWYPGNEHIFQFARVSGKSITCVTDRGSLHGAVWVGHPAGAQNCSGGNKLSGGQCTPLPKQPSENCSAGGVPQTGDTNPIDLLSGIKMQTFQDFATADGRLTFSRSYASRSYGSLNDNRVGLLGRAWSIDDIPRMSLTSTSSLETVTLFMSEHQAVQIKCSTSGCSTLSTERFGGGKGRVYLDETDTRFSGDLRSPQQSIPVIDYGNKKYIFKSVCKRLLNPTIKPE